MIFDHNKGGGYHHTENRDRPRERETGQARVHSSYQTKGNCVFEFPVSQLKQTIILFSHFRTIVSSYLLLCSGMLVYLPAVCSDEAVRQKARGGKTPHCV
jgi:hypothetical protein